MKLAAIYTRISKDREGAGLGVERQQADCRALAETLGYDIGPIREDNDLSAYSGKPRPGYLALLEDIRGGRIDAVIAWHTDRLHRSPVELEAYITACEGHGIPTHTVKAGSIDLATPSGRMMARTLGGIARYEVEHMIERQKAAKRQAATAGKWRGGRRPYGFAEDGVTVLPDEAAEVLRASHAVLNGSSLRRIALELNERGIPMSTGNPWRQESVRRMLIRPRNAGLIDHLGEIVGKAGWDPIVPEDIWRGVVATLTDPKRRTQLSSVRRWLGSGLYQCHCGATVRAMASGTGRAGSRIAYFCASGTKHVTRTVEDVDDFVTSAVIARLMREDARDLLAAPDVDVAGLHVRAASVRAQLDEVALMYARHVTTASQMETITTELRAELAGIDAELANAHRATALSGLIGADDLRAEWETYDLDKRRAVIAELMTVRLLPARKGRPPGWKPGDSYFEPETVELVWKN